MSETRSGTFRRYTDNHNSHTFFRVHIQGLWKLVSSLLPEIYIWITKAFFSATNKYCCTALVKIAQTCSKYNRNCKGPFLSAFPHKSVKHNCVLSWFMGSVKSERVESKHFLSNLSIYLLAYMRVFDFGQKTPPSQDGCINHCNVGFPW